MVVYSEHAGHQMALNPPFERYIVCYYWRMVLAIGILRIWDTILGGMNIL